MINIKKLLNLEFYTSPLDLFLEKWRSKHPDLTASQRAEKEKSERIAKLRDTKTNREVI